MEKEKHNLTHDSGFRDGEHDKKSFYEIYTTYIDPSSIIIDHYKNKKVYDGQESYFDELNEWLDDQSEPNRPFVLKSSPGMGTKTILTSWHQQLLQRNRTRKQKNLVVAHFASLQSNCSNYFYCLYRIITKLRESLKIEQKVDLLQEKIRKYFAYWLDICNSEIQKQQVIFCKENIYKKIVIIIEGVHLFKEAENGTEANIAFWLPDKFPKNIKILCTVGRGSESLEFLEKKGCFIIDMEISSNIARKMFEEILSTENIFDEEVSTCMKSQLRELYDKLIKKNNPQIYKILENFQGFFLPPKKSTPKNIIDYIKKVMTESIDTRKLLEKISKIESLSDLLSLVMEIWEDYLPCKKKLTQNLLYLCLSQKGLILKEIMELTKWSQKEWKLVTTIFSHSLLQHQENYSIKCKVLTDFLAQRFKAMNANLTSHSSHHPVRENSILLKQHEKIAECLENTPNSIRKLQEQTYHLFTAKSYFKLKQIVSNVQNFLLLFNSNNKYELSRYWQKLEEKGFDPVIEYNKAIQGFSMHYHPSDQNIFRIIVQISRFLKEFCDFQTYDTPKFRHPIIQGNMLQLHKIGLLKEFTQLDIYIDNSFNNNGVLTDEQITDASLEDQIKQIKEKYFPKDATEIQLDQIEQASPRKSKINNQKPIQLSNSILPTKARTKNNQLQSPSEIQLINVDVPKSRDKFREHYLKILQEFIKNDEYDQSNNEQGYFIVTCDDKNSSGALSSHQIAAPPEAIQGYTNELSTAKIKESYRFKPIKPSLYYYKRWIWIQFPWVCISLNNNYSNTPEFLLRNLEGRDIDTYEQEVKYTKQALMIAIEAKQKKKQMFVKKSHNQPNATALERMGMSTHKGLKNPHNMSTTNIGMRSSSGFGKYTNKYGMTTQKSSARSRINQKTFTNIDLSLNALTKQLQARKKNLPHNFGFEQNQLKPQSPTFFLSQINQNLNHEENDCQEDLKFINQRKNFNPPNISNMASNQILPKLKWTIKDHTNYQISYIKNHIEEKKKKLNKIIYQNKKLAEIYKELKLKENLSKKVLHYGRQTTPGETIGVTENLRERGDQDETMANTGQLELTQIHCQSSGAFGSTKSNKNCQLIQLMKKKESVIEQFCKSVLQKDRLKIILKLCAENKTKNQQSLSSLNYFLQSLKKMIQHEKANLKELSREISGIKLLKQRKNNMEQEKTKNQRLLQKQAKNYIEEKNKLENQIENISTVIGEQLRIQKNRLDNMFSGHLKSKEQRDVFVMQERKNKIMEEKLEEVKSQWQALKELFEIDEGENGIQNTGRFHELLEENQRNKKLKIIYFQKKNKLQQVRREHQKIKEKYNKEMAASTHIQLKHTEVPVQASKIKSPASSKQDLQLKIILNNIALKLGVREIEEIVPHLRNKMNKLKQSNPDKYNKVMNMASDAALNNQIMI